MVLTVVVLSTFSIAPAKTIGADKDQQRPRLVHGCQHAGGAR